jgi:hypothetical protein
MSVPRSAFWITVERRSSTTWVVAASAGPRFEIALK